MRDRRPSTEHWLIQRDHAMDSSNGKKYAAAVYQFALRHTWAVAAKLDVPYTQSGMFYILKNPLEAPSPWCSACIPSISRRCNFHPKMMPIFHSSFARYLTSQQMLILNLPILFNLLMRNHLTQRGTFNTYHACVWVMDNPHASVGGNLRGLVLMYRPESSVILAAQTPEWSNGW